MLRGGRRRKPAWPLGAHRRLRLSPLHCSNNITFGASPPTIYPELTFVGKLGGSGTAAARGGW